MTKDDLVQNVSSAEAKKSCLPFDSSHCSFNQMEHLYPQSTAPGLVSHRTQSISLLSRDWMKTPFPEHVDADCSAHYPRSVCIFEEADGVEVLPWVGRLFNKNRGCNKQEQIQAEDRTINTCTTCSCKCSKQKQLPGWYLSSPHTIRKSRKSWSPKQLSTMIGVSFFPHCLVRREGTGSKALGVFFGLVSTSTFIF